MFTQAERIERRKASKIASDRRCAARKNENARKYRAKRIALGLTSQGKPRTGRALVRVLMRDTVTPKRAQVSAPGQSVDEYLAQGGRMEVLPGCSYIRPSVMPYGARYG